MCCFWLIYEIFIMYITYGLILTSHFQFVNSFYEIFFMFIKYKGDSIDTESIKSLKITHFEVFLKNFSKNTNKCQKTVLKNNYGFRSNILMANNTKGVIPMP